MAAGLPGTPDRQLHPLDAGLPERAGAGQGRQGPRRRRRRGDQEPGPVGRPGHRRAAGGPHAGRQARHGQGQARRPEGGQAGVRDALHAPQEARRRHRPHARRPDRFQRPLLLRRLRRARQGRGVGREGGEGGRRLPQEGHPRRQGRRVRHGHAQLPHRAAEGGQRNRHQHPPGAGQQGAGVTAGDRRAAPDQAAAQPEHGDAQPADAHRPDREGVDRVQPPLPRPGGAGPRRGRRRRVRRAGEEGEPRDQPAVDGVRVAGAGGDPQGRGQARPGRRRLPRPRREVQERLAGAGRGARWTRRSGRSRFCKSRATRATRWTSAG